MRGFVRGEDRTQRILLPSSLDEYVTEENPVRIIEVFVDELDLVRLGFAGMVPAATGRPAYHPATIWINPPNKAKPASLNQSAGWLEAGDTVRVAIRYHGGKTLAVGEGDTGADGLCHAHRVTQLSPVGNPQFGSAQ
jgi:hypothetical protein